MLSLLSAVSVRIRTFYVFSKKQRGNAILASMASFFFLLYFCFFSVLERIQLNHIRQTLKKKDKKNRRKRRIWSYRHTYIFHPELTNIQLYSLLTNNIGVVAFFRYSGSWMFSRIFVLPYVKEIFRPMGFGHPPMNAVISLAMQSIQYCITPSLPYRYL